MYLYLFTCDSVRRGQELGAVYQSSPRLSRGGGRWPIGRQSCCTCAGGRARCDWSPPGAPPWCDVRALLVRVQWTRSVRERSRLEKETDAAVGPQLPSSFTGRNDGWTRRITRRKRSKLISNTGFTDNCGLLPDAFRSFSPFFVTSNRRFKPLSHSTFCGLTSEELF